MKAAKDKTSDGMFAIIEEMLRKTKCLCSLLDQNLVEEVFTFLEDNRFVFDSISIAGNGRGDNNNLPFFGTE